MTGQIFFIDYSNFRFGFVHNLTTWADYARKSRVRYFEFHEVIFGLFRSFFMCDYFYNCTKFCVIVFRITQDLVKNASCRKIMKITTQKTTRWRNFFQKFLAPRVIRNIVHEISCRYLTKFTLTLIFN